MIRIQHASASYAGRPVLHDVSLDIAPGSFVALVGQSGAGKTTLLKTINRLVPLDHGTISLAGQDIADRALPELRAGIGYVFQGIGLFPHLTVGENIWLTPRLQHRPEAERAGRIAQLLDLVALPVELAGRYPAQLSGGQAQRVGFARALAAGPKIMLMDEPFGALDPQTRGDLGETYLALHRRMGLTSVLVTHDMAEAMLLADRIVVMGDGAILADLPPARLLEITGNPAVDALGNAVRQQAARLAALAGGAPS